MGQKEIVEEFHRLWDNFPGMARLINKQHIVIAANEIACQKGFVEGCCCAKIGLRESHNGCKAISTLQERKAFIDSPNSYTIRGWMPIVGVEDMFIHFTLTKE